MQSFIYHLADQNIRAQDKILGLLQQAPKPEINQALNQGQVYTLLSTVTGDPPKDGDALLKLLPFLDDETAAELFRLLCVLFGVRIKAALSEKALAEQN